ncbi:MAG: hypothetical protein HC888_04610 [Candidatus Competibacteraceae bacterium]|nr:hypothetical protein [Candidatus Competibacteraceae bacterium]
MDELRPHQIPRGAVAVLSLYTHAGHGIRFDFPHRVPHRLAEGFEDTRVLRVGVKNGNRLGGVEIQVVAHRAAGFGADG